MSHSTVISPRLKEAAASLQQYLASYNWLSAVGVSQEDATESLLVYVKPFGVNQAAGIVPRYWHNIPVYVRRMDLPKPLSQKLA